MQCGVDEQHVGRASRRADIPRSGLDPDVVTDGAQLLELSIGNDDTVLAKDGDLGPVGSPNDILDLGRRDFTEDTTALDFKQDRTVFGTKEHATGGTTLEQAVDVGYRWLETLGGFVVEVLDDNLPLGAIKSGESVPAKEDSRTHAVAALTVRDGPACVGEGEGHEFVGATIHIGADKDIALRRVVLVVRQEPRCGPDAVRLGLLADPAERCDGDVHTGTARVRAGVVVAKQFASPHVVQLVGRSGRRGRSLPLEFEDNHSRVVSGRQQIL